jgi:hypothetical protein
VSGRLWFLLLGLALALPAEAAAQRARSGSALSGLSAGPRVGRDFKNKAWTVGGQLSLPIGNRLELRPSGDVFLRRGEGMGWQLNGDAAIRLGQGGGLYAGSGIALAHPDDSDTETGYNLFFGLSTAAPEQRTRGFLEFRWTFVNDTSPFRLALGFLYRL